MKKAEEILRHFTNGELEINLDTIDLPVEWIIQAMKEYAKKKCEEQRKICADKLYRDPDYGNVLSVESKIDIQCANEPEFN